MSAEPETAERVTAALRVRLETQRIDGDDAFEVFARLREGLGESEICLLESLGGPAADSNRAMIGIHPILDITIDAGRISLTGVPSFVEWADARLATADALTRVASGSFELERRRAVWDVLRHLQSGFEVDGIDKLTFGFGFHTVLSYDAVSYIEDIPQLIEVRGSDPDMVFRIYAATIDVDLPADLGRLNIASSELWDAVDADRIVELCAGDSVLVDSELVEGEVLAPGANIAPAFTMNKAEYVERAAVALDHIHAGDIYQVQLGYEITVAAERRDLDVYRRLRSINPSPYMAFLPLGDRTVISGSPELHVRIDNDFLTMRPIAGTARRTTDAQKNAENVAWLRQDAKEIAEHIMLVDLCRNDLGRVAVPGTVTVESLMNIEEYSHVYHLVSTVTAQMDQGLDAYDVICATFPAGTMTGAPKIRAMEIIESLEKTRRGIYAGVFGVIGFGGFTNLALTIRTIVASESGYTARASAGVVVDSSPESEWLETLAKMGSTTRAITNGDLA
ncbi:MAG: anthranilate synthase component [Actinomycetota bacterium]|jgi:anthranilate/para-aminobenzoate synthase component I|nr:anthranilate synthase component [Actinomycetota bacterium]